jgi:hypothetical protein
LRSREAYSETHLGEKVSKKLKIVCDHSEEQARHSQTSPKYLLPIRNARKEGLKGLHLRGRGSAVISIVAIPATSKIFHQGEHDVAEQKWGSDSYRRSTCHFENLLRWKTEINEKPKNPQVPLLCMPC